VNQLGEEHRKQNEHGDMKPSEFLAKTQELFVFLDKFIIRKYLVDWNAPEF
jgi:hypothetical protein